MYAWKLVGHLTSEATVSDGVGDDLSAVMRQIEAHLAGGSGFVARVSEVVPCLSVFQLNAVHVPTGREWHARRDRRGGVHWEQRFRPVDPDVAYTFDDDGKAGGIAS